MAKKKFECDVRKAGLTLGVVFALWHLAWVLLVTVLGKSFVAWVSSLHFVSMSYTVMAFDLFNLLVGLVAAFLTGYVTGAVFAYIYNKLE